MDETYRGDLSAEKQRAIERMREMNSRSKYHRSTPDNCNINKADGPPRQHGSDRSFLSNLGIPFLSNIGADPDISLILGLALILMSESSDRLLLLALLYILL